MTSHFEFNEFFRNSSPSPAPLHSSSFFETRRNFQLGFIRFYVPLARIYLLYTYAHLPLPNVCPILWTMWNGSPRSFVEIELTKRKSTTKSNHFKTPTDNFHRRKKKCFKVQHVYEVDRLGCSFSCVSHNFMKFALTERATVNIRNLWHVCLFETANIARKLYIFSSLFVIFFILEMWNSFYDFSAVFFVICVTWRVMFV